VDDSPRYEALGRWFHLGNLSEWRSELTQRPLPRRESKRDDYNVLLAYNIHALTATGWVHEQHNTKLNHQDTGDKVLAREQGLNHYRLTRADRAQPARAWWQMHQGFWAEVRRQWAEVLGRQPVIALEHKVEGKTLFANLGELEDQKLAAPALATAIRRVIEAHLKAMPTAPVLN
jgi:hypothetical protein